VNRFLKKKHGQAIIEYVLLTALMAGIFSWVFGIMRQSMFKLWFCDITPKIITPGGCNSGAACGQKLQKYDSELHNKLIQYGCEL